MKTENIGLITLGGFAMVVLGLFLIPSKKTRDKQGSNSSANLVGSAIKSIKASVDSIATSEPTRLGKSIASTYSSGGSKRTKKAYKRKTKV
jgi:hypothetical protein